MLRVSKSEYLFDPLQRLLLLKASLVLFYVQGNFQKIEKTYEPSTKQDHPGYTKDLDPLAVLHLNNRL